LAPRPMCAGTMAMLEITIPGRETIQAMRVVLDVNGTLTIDGALLPGLSERIGELKRQLVVTLLTADTFSTAGSIAETLGVEVVRLACGDGATQKLSLVKAWDASGVIAIGNGENDALMLEAAALGIGVLQAEGAAASALLRADVVFPSICDALDALLSPSRLIATLRK